MMGDHFRRHVLYLVPRSSNGHGEPMAICSEAARYFGVTPRSMQRLWAAFYGPQRPSVKR